MGTFMRLFPILAALIVMALVYAFVFERDALLALLSQPQEELAEDDAADAGSDGGEAAQDDTAGSDEAVGVIAVHSVAEVVDNAVILRGQTEADRQVDVRAETSGKVVSEPLQKGAFVEAGQQLCRLEPDTREVTLAEAQARMAEAQARVPEARARLQEAEARLAEARINDNAASELSQEGFASETRVAATKAAMRSAEAAVETAKSNLESTRANIRSAEAAVAAAEEEIARLTITAPFAGRLESDTAELGSLLQPGALCATVIRLDPMKLVGFVTETAVSRIEPGARATARLASGQRVEGEVVFLSRAADPDTRTFRVEVEVANDDLSLRDGQSAEIMIAAEGARAHRLPQSALTLDDEGTMGVRLVDDDGSTTRFAPVSILRDTPEGAWLTGLPETADVIVIGQEYVTDDVPVAPSFREAAQ